MHSLCRGNAKKKDVRTSNIEAAKAVADSIRTSLGPRGMDKMVRSTAASCLGWYGARDT
jgi:T-complex protein 1 subunit delta